MKLETDDYRDVIQKKLEDWLETIPVADRDRAMVGVAGQHSMLTPRSIVNEVRNRTPTGQAFMKRWVETTLLHIMNADLQASDDEEPLALPGR